MSWYSIALFAHIVGVLVLFIMLAAHWFITLRLRTAGSINQVREWIGLAKPLGKLAPISGVLILGAGIYMTAVSWTIFTTWIDVTLAAMGLMMFISMGVVSRKFAAIGREVNQIYAEVSPDELPLTMQIRLDDPALWVSSQMVLAVALSIVFMMTVKPNLAVSIISVVVALALGALAGALTARPHREPRSAPLVKEASVG